MSGLADSHVGIALAIGAELVLKVWVTHYNGARPHMALGPGVPDPPLATVRASTQLSGHQIGGRLVLRVKSILAGLHHEYSLAPALG
jgi:putative transposase